MVDDVTRDIFASFGISAREVEKSIDQHMVVYRMQDGDVDGETGLKVGRGSREGRMGEVRAPGTRRVAHGSVHVGRFTINGYV